MLIKSPLYKINKKTGEIIKRQKVTLKCDDCGIKWQTNYDYVKRKRKVKGDYSKDYCVRCRAKSTRKIIRAPMMPRIKIICLYCKKEFLRYSSRIVEKNNFCSLGCKRDYDIKIKYSHLYQTFDENKNEIAYLFGLILGDGNLRKSAKNTTRISIGFDIKYEELISMFKTVARELRIKYFIEPKRHSNCQSIGFALPDKLLEKYGMLWNGSKFDAQPKPVDKIIDNINFVAGLINSDGWCGFVRTKTNKFRKIGFNNTVSNIAECFKQSLENNGIDYRCYHINGRLDKRTNNMSKEQWMINVNRKKSIDSIIDKCSYSIKEFI